MGVLTSQQGRNEFQKRDEKPQNLVGSRKDNLISTESEHSAIKTSSEEINGIGEGLLPQEDKNIPPNDFVEHDSIQIQFEHLNKA
jgi:hypothetical protein